MGIRIPKEISKKVVDFQNEIKKLGIDAKFVESENLHINLKFFGSKTDEQIEDIKKIIANVSKNVNQFELSLKNIGVFPSEKFIRVLWIGVEPEKLKELYNKLEENFKSIGIENENRPFKPHLTLCRLRNQKNKEILIKKINEKFNFGGFIVNSLYLIESKLSTKGPKYINLYEFKLKK